jgi:MtN3 and saliva related transmembrane protein
MDDGLPAGERPLSDPASDGLSYGDAGKMGMPTNVELLGYAAGTLTTIAFVPQVLKALKTHSTKDISLGMFVVFTAGVVLWGLYGLVLGSWPIIVANAVTLVLTGTILALKLRHG